MTRTATKRMMRLSRTSRYPPTARSIFHTNQVGRCDEDEPKTPKKPRTPKTPKTPASRKKVKTEPQVLEQAEDDIAVVAAGDVLADDDEIPF